ncbi:MAG: methylmalonyl-CoA mutase family protein [Alphaproteobacteria bacterium]
MSGDTEMALADGFEPADYQDWRTAVEAALKGGNFEKSLTKSTYDGFRLQPLYMAGDAPENAVRPATGRGSRASDWDIRQAVTGPTAADVQSQATEELAEGATSILLRLDTVLRQGGTPESLPDQIGIGGAALHTEASLVAALSGLTAPVSLDAGAAGLAAAKALLSMGAPAAGSSLSLDPISAMASSGLAGDTVGAWVDAAAGMGAGSDLSLMRASSAVFFDAGASEATELGCLIASGVAYLRALESTGMDVAAAASKIDFTIALSQDQFMTIAKVRAARTLWAAVLHHAGVASAPMRLDGVTAERMFTRHDMHVNVLRATIAGFAGAVGGLDGLTILPFDARSGGRDPLATRVARNLQIVLAEESNLGKVADPSGGSFFVEQLTQQLAAAGWSEFQAIEQAGGMRSAIEGGMLTSKIGETMKARQSATAKRREAITGVSEFANLDEPAVVSVDLEGVAEAAQSDWQSGNSLITEPLCSGAGPLAFAPMAAPYEAMRDASDAYLKKSGERPTVFLANIGALSAFNTRATFAANAFAAGGMDVAGKADEGYADAATAATAFQNASAKIACICGSDAGYSESAIDFAKALKSAGATQVWLAGRGGAAEADFRQAGIDEFIYMGADILAALKAAHRAIGV